MTTLRIEVARSSGTTVQNVVDGLRKAGCMKHCEIYTDHMTFLPVEELRAALVRDGFYVDLIEEPPPPPLPWWRYVQAWPRRIYYWGRRVVLRESMTDQLLRVLYPPERTRTIHEISMRESPSLRKRREDSERDDH